MSKLTKRVDNYSEWYNQLVENGDLAEHSAVRGCMVIKPHGFAIWERIQSQLDKRFKETGHQNAYFPIFIPKSYLSKEADHVEGFAKECAVVTHYRLKMSEDGKGVVVDPTAKLDEELIVRPTSETIIWNSFKGWIQSYRDLPLLINQWANVVRWEMRTRLFLRTAEFLWQEGHTAHATKAEAITEAEMILDLYADFLENYMAIPVIKGIKTASERFAGAIETYCVEALMQDGKALQAGTSHFLGQNFAKAFEVQFADKTGKLEYVWATSWGVSTRLMGALIMTHSDDAGLVIPPKLAPTQVVIIPIYRNDEQFEAVSKVALKLKSEMEELGLRVKFDDDDNRKPGWKFAEYEMKGIPVRIAIGPRDIENGKCEMARRDELSKELILLDDAAEITLKMMDTIQENLYKRAEKLREDKTHSCDNWEDFKDTLANKGGFIYAHWDGSDETERKIKDATKATIRCIPLDSVEEDGLCVFSGKPSKRRVLFAKAY
jgi:prolyl-tRNA synthetase